MENANESDMNMTKYTNLIHNSNFSLFLLPPYGPQNDKIERAKVLHAHPSDPKHLMYATPTSGSDCFII